MMGPVEGTAFAPSSSAIDLADSQGAASSVDSVQQGSSSASSSSADLSKPGLGFNAWRNKMMAIFLDTKQNDESVAGEPSQAFVHKLAMLHTHLIDMGSSTGWFLSDLGTEKAGFDISKRVIPSGVIPAAADIICSKNNDEPPPLADSTDYESSDDEPPPLTDFTDDESSDDDIMSADKAEPLY